MNPGVYSKAELLAPGVMEREIRAAVESQKLIRIKPGWFANPTANHWAIQAVRAGGRLGCLSGCAVHGLWTPRHGDAHVVLPKGISALGRITHRTYGRLPKSAVSLWKTA